MSLRKHHLHLKRELTFWDLVIYGLSIIIGAGIYALIGKAAGISGNAVWISFILAGIIAAITGLSYAELSSMFPRDSAEYKYSEEAFRSKKFAFSISWLMIFIGAVGAAAVSLGFGGYLEALIGTPIIYNALGLLAFLTVLAVWGMKESMEALYAMTLATIAGLVAIVAYSWKYIGTVDYFEMPRGIPGVLEASAFVFFAYLGFEALANASEEAKNPRKTVPRAMIASIGISALLYVAVAIASVSVIPWEALSQSSAPMADIAARVMPNATALIIIVALFATASTVLAFVVSTSRRLYGMAEEHTLPKIFSQLDPKRQTPVAAIVSFAAISALFTLIGDITFVANVTNFGSFFIFAAVHASTIYLRYREPGRQRKYRMPLNAGKFPVLAGAGLLLSLAMMLEFEMPVILLSIAIFLLGAPMYTIACRLNAPLRIPHTASRVHRAAGLRRRNGR